jgi:hypothetical protein
MSRGILSTCYARLVSGKLPAGKKGEAELRQLYLDFYKDEPFVKIADASPHTKHTWGNNMSTLAASRIEGKPFVVSEWGHPWPNEWRAEGSLPMAAVGAFQGWDGILGYTQILLQNKGLTSLPA